MSSPPAVSRFVPGFDIGEVPVADSALEGLLNSSSLMDVPFRAMQQQHLLVYLASIEDHSPAEGEVSGVNMQMYAAFDMEAAGYLDFGEGQVRTKAHRNGANINRVFAIYQILVGWNVDIV